MYKNRKKLTLVFAILLCLASCTNEVEEIFIDEELLIPTKTNYETTTVEIGDYVSEVSSPASPVYVYERKLCYDGEATFEEFLVERYDEVKKGDKLASFSVYGSQVPLEEKKLELTRVQNELERNKESYEVQKEKSQEDLAEIRKDSLAYQIKSLEIEKEQVVQEQYVFNTNQRLNEIQKQIYEIGEDLEMQYLLAPFNGTVVELAYMKQGDQVNSSLPILMLVSTDQFLLEIGNTKGFRYNDEIDIEVSMGRDEIMFTGKVVSLPTILSSEFSDMISYVEINLEEVSEEDVDRFDSQFNRVKLYTQAVYMPDVLIVDADAVEKSGGEEYVSVLENDTVKRRYITSAYSDNETYWIVNGLSEGQTVVIE